MEVKIPNICGSGPPNLLSAGWFETSKITLTIEWPVAKD
jgi:hypothetical protein